MAIRFLLIGQSVWRFINKVLRGLFFEENAFTFKGVVNFSVRLLGVVAVLISAQLLTRPAVVQVRNVEPFGCLDLAQYEESFNLKNFPYPEKLRKVVQAFSTRPRSPVSVRFDIGDVARGFPDPSAVEHQIVCWYVRPRSMDRQRELKELQDRERAKLPTAGSGDLPSQLQSARRSALAEDPIVQLEHKHEFSASQALFELRVFAVPGDELSISTVLKPAHKESRYAIPEAWKEDLAAADIQRIDELVVEIERAGLERLELALAFEQIDDVRRFINIIEVSNESGAVAPQASVSIYRQAGVEILGGTLMLAPRGDWLSAKVEDLLPGEKLHAVLKTRRPVEDSHLRVASDPTLFLMPRDIRWLQLIAGFVLILWCWANWQARRRQFFGNGMDSVQGKDSV